MAVNKFPTNDDDWRSRLTPEQYRVLREAGTEIPGTSSLLREHRDGAFHCAGCDAPLFPSDAKFDSGTGWPSFDRALPGAVTEHHDTSHGMQRTEFRCAHCGGHLGHLFNDGSTSTGMRYCTNGCALSFEARKS